MRKTNAALNAAIAILFAGVMIYLGVYVFRSFHTGYVTAGAVYMELEETGQAQGLIIREETVLFSGKPYLDVIAQDGKNIAVGETVANAMDSQDSMADTARIHELEMQISRAESAADSGGSGEDSQIRPALIQLSAAVARGRIADIYEPEVTIASALFRSDSLTVSDSDLAAMKAELAGLKNRTANRATAITSPVAGVFTTAVDGYEHLDPSDLTELTPESLRALTEYRDDTEGNLGKVVTGTKWYFAALVSEADAARLEEGGTALLELGKYASGTVPAVVIRISHPSGGWCAVVFKCRTALNDTIALRELTADIVYDRVSGLRIPAKSVHVDEDGQTFVYVISAMEVEKKTVEVICSTGDYYIVSVESRADALRAGNEIIVSGRGVEEGLLLK